MSHLLFVIFLGPLLVLQGIYVRLTVTRLPEAPGKRSGRKGSGPPMRVLIVGDSAAAGVGADAQAQALAGQLAEHLAATFSVSWKLEAENGRKTIDTLSLLQTRPPEPFDTVVTSLGVNDITAGVSLETWMKRQQRLVDLIRKKFRAKQILLSAVPPMHLFPALPQPLRWVIGKQAQRFNRALEAWARTQPDCNFLTFSGEVDASYMAPDGFHPGPRAYRRWGKTAAEVIARKRPARGQNGEGHTTRGCKFEQLSHAKPQCSKRI